jgi:hypothetical protein
MFPPNSTNMLDKELQHTGDFIISVYIVAGFCLVLEQNQLQYVTQNYKLET